MPSSSKNLMDVFHHHLECAPFAPAMSWVPERSQDQAQHLSSTALYESCVHIAQGLLQLDWPSTHPRMIILAFSPGLDFIQAFLACQLAGVIAVPIAMPRRGRDAHILEAIVGNCAATWAMTAAADLTRLHEVFSTSDALSGMQLVCTTELAEAGQAANSWSGRSAQEFAFIQYTSGSSSLPKGVLVSHGNLLANLALIEKGFRLNPEFTMVNWLPHYHDMGLIGGLLVPVFMGIPCVSMAPSAFIKRPLKWLQIISAQDAGRSVISGGPNFAYQLCADRVAEGDIPSLSLQAWKTAFNGAEPIRAQTLRQFARRFAAGGFSDKNLLTCYGLAEATLYATGNHEPVILTASILGLEQGHILPPQSPEDSRELVASGLADTERVAIVDPASKLKLPAASVGEIWVSGTSIPEQYFNNEVQSAMTFHAKLAYQAGTNAQRYLVTGDLGAIVDGHLYVTGRSKEMLIVNGRNIYPHDVESLLLNADAGIEDAAVFSYDDAQAKSESIIVICELGRASRQLFAADEQQSLTEELEKLATRIRVIIAAAEITITHLRFVGPMGISKTTSGKTSYGQNRRAFAELPETIRARSSSAEFRNKE